MTIQHRDIPDSQLHETKGAASALAGQILTATGAGTATFQTPDYTKSRFGFWDYNDEATQTTPLALSVVNTEYQIPNDGLGDNTEKAFALPGVPEVFNTFTNYFDFSDLSVGDVLDIRIDLTYITTGANTVVETILELGIGGTPYRLSFGKDYFKTAGTHQIVRSLPLYIGDSNTLDFPARFLAKSDTAGTTLKVNGWFVKAHTNG